MSLLFELSTILKHHQCWLTRWRCSEKQRRSHFTPTVGQLHIIVLLLLNLHISLSGFCDFKLLDKQGFLFWDIKQRQIRKIRQWIVVCSVVLLILCADNYRNFIHVWILFKKKRGPIFKQLYQLWRNNLFLHGKSKLRGSISLSCL